MTRQAGNRRCRGGGWCPKGRKSEDGAIPDKYNLVETKSGDYRVRTEQNVVDSDATVAAFMLSAKSALKWPQVL
jgi:hypothetical protein